MASPSQEKTVPAVPPQPSSAPLPRPALRSGTVYQLNTRQRLLFWPAAWSLRGLTRSWRVRFQPDEVEAVRALSTPPFYIVWHNRSLVFPETIERMLDPQRIACLISASRLAAWETAYFRWRGFQVIRGSSTRRGFHATREMLRAHRAGVSLGISPDGPAGPLYQIKRGALVMPRKLQCPLVLFGASCRHARRLRTWDRHLVPLPLARLDIRLRVLDPIPDHVPEEELATNLRKQLIEINQDSFRLSNDDS